MEGKIFFSLCILTVLFAISNGGSHAMHYQDYDTYILSAKLCRMVSDITPLFILFQWIVFVDYTLYQSKDNLLRRYKFAFALVVLCVLLMIVNLFIPVAYEFDKDLFCNALPPFYIMMGIEYLFLLISFFIILQYRKRHKQGFFMIFPFMIPVILGVTLNDIISREIGTFGIGIAVGLVMMYLFMYRGIALVDEDSGFYKAGLLELLRKYPADQTHGGTGIVFSCDSGDLTGILQSNRPSASLVVQLSEKEYLLLAGNQPESAIRMLISCVEEEAQEAGIPIHSRFERMKKGQTPEDFLKQFYNF